MKKKTPEKILSVNFGNFIIYCAIMACSIVFLAGYFIFCLPEFWRAFALSIGSSAFASSLLAFLIERSNNIEKGKEIKQFRKHHLESLKSTILFMFERTVWYFFNCYKDIIGDFVFDYNYKIEFSELWQLFKKLSDKYENNNIKEEKKYISSRWEYWTKHIINHYKNTLLPEIQYINSSIKIYEIAGFFNYTEKNSLETVELFLLGLNELDRMPYEDFQFIFKTLASFPEIYDISKITVYRIKNETFACSRDKKMEQNSAEILEAKDATFIEQQICKNA